MDCLLQGVEGLIKARVYFRGLERPKQLELEEEFLC